MISQRSLAWALAGLSLLPLAAFLASPGLLSRLLAREGCDVGTVGWEGAHLIASPIQCGPLHAQTLQVDPWRLQGWLLDVTLDLGTAWPLGSDHVPPAWGAAPGSAALRSSKVKAAWLSRVQVRGLTLQVGEVILAEGLEGGLDPLDLHGEGFRLHDRDGGVQAQLQREVEAGPWRGDLSMDLSWGGDDLFVEVKSVGSSISHPLLARRPLSLPPLSLRGSARLSGEAPEFEGVLDGGPELHVSVTLAERPQIHLHLPDTDAAAALTPLEPLLPELAWATVSGTIGFTASIEGGDLTHAEIRMAGIQVEGALPPGLDLRRGPFTYRIRGSDGGWLNRRSGEGSRGWVPLPRVSPHLVHAVLAAEDAAFHSHQGYHLPSIQAALEANIARGRVSRGGSTITQQLAKNLILDGRQSMDRKLRELLLAVDLDRTLGKARVLELYLNVVEWGPDIWGIGEACDHYLLKAPARVNPLEAAFLATLLPNPREGHRRWYVPGEPDMNRISDILTNMADAGWLDRAEAERLMRTPLQLVPPPANPSG